MLANPQPPRIDLPKGWQDFVKPVQMFLHTICERRLPVHQSLGGNTPAVVSGESQPLSAVLSTYSWTSHCNGLFRTPIAA